MSTKILPRKTPVYSQFRKRPTGHVLGDEYRKPIKDTSYLRQPPAICFEVYSLRQAEQAGARHILVYNTQTGVEHRTTFAKFMRESFELNRGFGRQRGMRLEEWDTTEPEPEPVQLGLFGW